MTKTVTEHMRDADQIVAHVKEANALVEKLKRCLATERAALEWLLDFAPQDWVKKSTQYAALGDFPNNAASFKQMVERRISAINELLGDRA